jgi:glycosyltransferase involved in cell wall biosynthesis
VLLPEAVHSCLAQTYADVEIIIADDSRSDHSVRAIEPLLRREKRIRYHRNSDRLRQAENVNQLFHLAQGPRLMLLHDDDRLLADAVEILDRCWQEHAGIVVCHGKQAVISHGGSPLPHESIAMDGRHYRTARHNGRQQHTVWSGLVEQIRPNGALLSADAARATGYRPYAEVGDDCDYDFALRLAQHNGAFFFVDRYISE